MCKFSLRTIVASSVLLTACQTPTPDLDRKIAVLNGELTSARLALDGTAMSYLASPGQDYRLQLTSAPISDAIDAYNGLSTGDKIIAFSSTSSSGDISEAYTNCPWPFSGRFGWELRLDPVPAALDAALYIDHIDHSINGSGGFQLGLHGTGAIGGVLVYVNQENCNVINIPVSAGFGGVVSYTNYAAAHVDLVANDGNIEYQLNTDQPLYLFAAIYVPPVALTTPFVFRGTLTKGAIAGVIGQSGQVTLSSGATRRYQLNVDLRDPKFVDGGLSIGGPIEVQWLDPPL
jgi:hypothetical protein